MPDQLPPLQTLRAFEATGRRRSMTLAAEELHLTHGAVSRQIKTLEDHLAVRLFRRMTRRIELTEAGVSFFGAVTRLLSELAREAENVRRRSEDTRLVISAWVSFASKWLTPRLHRLMARYPGLDVQLDVTDNVVDFTQGRVDVAVRYGVGRYPHAATERMMDETITPVCTPEYRGRMGGLHSPDGLAGSQLMHEIGMTATWDHWFAMMGVPAAGTRGPATVTAACPSRGRSGAKGWRLGVVCWLPKT